MRTFASLMLALFVFVSPVQAHENDAGHGLMIEKAWARKTSRTVSAAAYFIIRNDSHAMETLTGVSADIAESAMIHRSYEADGMMRMDHVETLPIAPGEALTFAPGGYHVMLMGLSQPLAEGDVFYLTLHFENAGDIAVVVEVTGMMGPQ